jgi:hypothetical protein
MKRNLATFTAIAILAIGGWSMAALADDQEAVRLSRQSLGVMQAAGDKVASPVSASSNGTSVFSSIEKASAPKGEDTDSLRLELIGCLLVMLAVPAGALLGVCYCDRRDYAAQVTSTMEPLEPPKGRPTQCPPIASRMSAAVGGLRT